MNEQATFPGQEGPRRWEPQIPWYALLLVGWLLYEYTSQPALAAAVTCAKFGWTDLRTALWLRRVDPSWRRGQTCFWFYLAYGLWKVALMATLVMAVLLVLSAGARRQPAGPGAPLSPAVRGVLLAAGGSFGLSFLLTYVSLWSALRNRVKVWLGAAPHLARAQRYWPPCQGQQNAAPFVAVTTCILTLWFAVLGTAWAGMALGPAVGFLLVLLLALASPVTLFVLKYLEKRVFARSPEECWPPEEVGLVCQTDDLDPALGEG
jgi:hypothetical protein